MVFGGNIALAPSEMPIYTNQCYRAKLSYLLCVRKGTVRDKKI
jgi:hypothetical protein